MKTARATKEIEKIKEKILNGALKIIVKEGFDALTIRNLGKKLGMTGPNIYNYFSGKDAIYLSLVIKGYEKLYSDLIKVNESSTDSYQRIKNLIKTYLHFGLENKNYYDIMFRGTLPQYKDYIGTPHEELAQIEHQLSLKIIDLTSETFANLAQENPKVSLRMRQIYVAHVWGLLHGLISLYHSNMIQYVVEDPENLYDELVEHAMSRLI